MKNYAYFIVFTFLSVFASAAKADNVRIMEVDNQNLGEWNLTSLSGNDPVCVYRSNNNDAYTITVTDDSFLTQNGFYLEDKATGLQQIPYSITWGNTPAPGTTAIYDGVTVNGSGANTVKQNCNKGDSANIKIDVNNSDMAAVPAGVYKSTVTVVIGQ